jgi:hypothetical protein
MNGLVAFGFCPGAKKDQAEDFIAIDAAVDHQLVSVFEDMEWNDDVWEQNQVWKRKEGYLHFALPKTHQMNSSSSWRA